MAFDRFFGFNTTQKNTLERLLASDDAGLSALAAAVDELSDDLEAVAETADEAQAITSAIPTSDPGDGVTIWNDGGVLKLASGP